MMRAVVLAGCVFLSSQFAMAKDQTVSGQTHLKKMMAEKLETYQQMMGYLVTNNFNGLARAGQKMQDIARSNSWHRGDDEEFVEINEIFFNIAKRLKRRAQAKSIEDVSMEYVHMTLTCVQCHKSVRDKK